MVEQTSPVLQVKGLKVTVKTEQGNLPLVHGVDFELKPGRILGLVGESGSGKTVTSLSLLQMLDRKMTTIEGSIRLNSRELNGLKEDEMRRIRGKEIAFIMQNPMNAFSPVYTLGTQFIETIRTHTSLSKKQAAELAAGAMSDLNLSNPAELLRQYPFELSGGMLQRVMIALTMCLEPAVIIADEPTTALDVTNQLQVLRQLDRVRQEHGTSILLISHDLGVIAELADDVAVMQQGRIVEQADVFELFDHPQHAYTKTLLAARPMLQISPEMAGCIWS
ncbi:nickel import ATP-binding protein NikD [Paenibacillus caseinilyticus]|uniref:nickel import ATP-binding protein NikD n=1 Tax=Paenibacillus caseinilyticus TaxID=3098138 RepID=UPI0022B8F59B|nr:nickel import ATP-binding protein NikD [Paenibacillus caseinilyticus]MCZ8519403.1 nickel import ATP-binding protein NikD [Paenibacillus caseinilyticus]